MQQFHLASCREMVILIVTPRRAWLRANQIGSFGVQETYFWRVNFHFVNMPHAAAPFTACKEMGILHSLPWKCMTPRELWPSAIQIGAFGVQETYFWKVNFHFVNVPHEAVPFCYLLTCHMPQFHFSACREMGNVMSLSVCKILPLSSSFIGLRPSPSSSSGDRLHTSLGRSEAAGWVPGRYSSGSCARCVA